MENRDARSSSIDLSSAPSSDVEGPSLTRPASNNSHTINVLQDQSNVTASKTQTGVSDKIDGVSATRQGSAAVKAPRKPRKKKEVDASAPEKEKKPRKPRASAGTTAASRKKPKLENAEPANVPQHVSHTNDLSTSRLVEPAAFVTDVKPPVIHEAAKYSQNGFSNHVSTMKSQPQSPTMPRFPTATTQPVVPPPRAVFDPVRSIALERNAQANSTPAPPSATPPRPTTFRPSVSPAISSIINPPDVREPIRSAYQPPTTYVSPVITKAQPIPGNGTASNPMELDVPAPRETLTRKSSNAEEPTTENEAKPKRAKEKPPPLPAGSGLLSSSLFGGESSSNEKGENEKGQSIVLHIDLKKPENKVINFARMAEEKYGFAALYPRQAAQKERLAKVAAAGAAIERSSTNGKRGASAGDSGDEDLDLDDERDSENDGDIAMGGVNGTNDNSGTDGPVPKKRRQRRDDYDADDPFVDDSELLWESQAAASKDGFFVYCGPLVPEGEKAAVERADGTVKRGRGRGRGGGPGSRGGRAAAATSGASGEGSSRGGAGAGSRGGGVTRKPRITKAERAQREAEKKNREQMATLAAKPPTFAA